MNYINNNNKVRSQWNKQTKGETKFEYHSFDIFSASPQNIMTQHKLDDDEHDDGFICRSKISDFDTTLK